MEETELPITTHAESCFDPALYASLFYGDLSQNTGAVEAVHWSCDRLHNFFQSGRLHGKRLLDIGTGPVVHPVIPAARWYDEIYLSDLWEPNLEYLQKWRRGESQHMKPVMEYFSQKENRTWLELNQEVADKVKNIVELDIKRLNPLENTELEGMVFDAITTSLCLQAAAVTIDNLLHVIQNIRKLLQPGGHLVVIDVIGQEKYAVGDMTFKSLSSTTDEIQSAYKACGFEIEEWQTKTFVVDPTADLSVTVYMAGFRKPELV